MYILWYKTYLHGPNKILHANKLGAVIRIDYANKIASPENSSSIFYNNDCETRGRFRNE